MRPGGAGQGHHRLTPDLAFNSPTGPTDHLYPLVQAIPNSFEYAKMKQSNENGSLRGTILLRHCWELSGNTCRDLRILKISSYIALHQEALSNQVLEATGAPHLPSVLSISGIMLSSLRMPPLAEELPSADL